MNDGYWHGVDEFFHVDVGPDEGWFYSNSAGGEIHKNPPDYPNSDRFKDHDEAIAFVKRRADEGSAFHQAALAQQIRARLLK